MAADRLPIPQPPRTPTPPTPIPEEQDTRGLGIINGTSRNAHSTIYYDPNNLSPLTDTFPSSGRGRFGSMSSTMANTPSYPDGTMGIPTAGGGGGGPPNPFNFQTQTIKDTPVIAKSVCHTQISCIPSSNVQTDSPRGLPGAENQLPASAQTCLRSEDCQKELGEHETEDMLSPLLSEQAGNVFRFGPFVSSRSQMHDDGSAMAIRERRIARAKLSSSLTPPTDSHPWIFPHIDLNKQILGQRKGHRYKHSSVSTQHQIFLEPPPRAPLALPASLPVPTFKEAWASTSREQRIRLSWCLCHLLVAIAVNYASSGSLSMTALSHLIGFDAVSALICVSVDIFHNFEIWKRSSIRHPFGLERAEVLAGFGMSVCLLFMGFDLISHNLKHMLEGLGSHTPHHPHSHQRVSPGSIDFAALLSIVATLVSAFGLKNHARIGKAMRFAVLSNFPSVLSNPSHFLTLSSATIMLLLPLFTINMYRWLDRLFCTLIGGAMFSLGLRLAIAQALMLLMSYSGKGVSDVMREIANEPQLSGVEEAKFWQVHYGLCMANLKLRIRGNGLGIGEEQAVAKLRERITMLIRNRLGGGYGKGAGLKWEVTVQFSAERRRAGHGQHS